MGTSLLTYAGVHATAPHHRPATVPPIALLVRLDATVDLTSPATLLQPCIQITTVTHPILDALLTQAGARRDRRTYVVTAHPDRAPSAALAAALTAPHPGTWKAAGHRTLPDILGPGPLATMAAVDTAPHVSRPRRVAGMSLSITRAGNKLRITATTDDLVVAGHLLTPGPRGALHLTPTEALHLIHAARGDGLVVLAAGTPGRLELIERLVEHGCVLRPVPGAPAWALADGGQHAGKIPTGPIPATAAAALASKPPAGAVIAIDPAVTDVAHAAAAATTSTSPARSSGTLLLHPWQRHFVDAYLASGPGLVNALPPGAGKTVCAATAMAARASGTPGYRAVVLAPSAIRSQWASELARAFPDAHVTPAETIEALQAAAATWTQHAGPHVLVCTPQLLTLVPAAQLLRCDDLVVDEATYLRNPDSVRSRAAWTLRGHAAHAMALSGTPEGTGGGTTEALLAFARNVPDLFAGYPLGQPHPTVTGDRTGALVHTDAGTYAKHTPSAEPVTVVNRPKPLEQAVDRVARTRVAALLAQRRPAITALRTELDAWRLGLAAPTALLASRYQLGDDVRASLGAGPAAETADDLGTKARWILDRVQEVTAHGGQVLVFSDFVTALAPLADALTGSGVSHASITGTARRRDQALADFENGAVQVLLVAASGHLGLNLQRAGTVLHLDVPVTPAALRQRTARAARLGSMHTHVRVEIPVLASCADHDLLTLLDQPGPTTDTWEIARHLLRRQNRAA